MKQIHFWPGVGLAAGMKNEEEDWRESLQGLSEWSQ